MPDAAITDALGDAFEQGQAAMESNGSWLVATHQAAGIDFGIAPLPKGPAGQATSIDPTGAVVYKGTKNPDAAWAFVKYLASPAAQTKKSRPEFRGPATPRCPARWAAAPRPRAPGTVRTAARPRATRAPPGRPPAAARRSARRAPPSPRPARPGRTTSPPVAAIDRSVRAASGLRNRSPARGARPPNVNTRLHSVNSAPVSPAWTTSTARSQWCATVGDTP